MSGACDSSLLVPALNSRHPDHEAARTAMAEVTGVPSHVLLETFSVLTRLPAPFRVSPRDAGSVVEQLPLRVLGLPAARHAALIADCARHRVAGGAVYDALVGATARHHDLTLLTRDRRARRTYDTLGVQVRFVG